MCGAAVESGDTGWVVYYDDVVKDYDPQFTLHTLTHRKIQIGGLNYSVSIAKVMGPYHLIRLQTDEAEEMEYWPEPFLIHNGQVLQVHRGERNEIVGSTLYLHNEPVDDEWARAYRRLLTYERQVQIYDFMIATPFSSTPDPQNGVPYRSRYGRSSAESFFA